MEYVHSHLRGLVSLMQGNTVVHSERYADKDDRLYIIRKWRKRYREGMLEFSIHIKPDMKCSKNQYR